MICIGHSHMVCMLNAAEQAGLQFRAVMLKGVGDGGHLFGLDQSRLIEDTGKPNFNDRTRALLDSTDGPVYSFISTTKHVQLGLRRLDDPSEPLFDFVLPEAPHLPLDDRAEIIPSGGMREIIRDGIWIRLKLMRRLTAMAPGRVIQFAPPPPVSDAWLEAFVCKGMHGADRTLLPGRTVRWKLWRLTVDLFRQQADRVGARFVDAPPESLDPDGFMRDELVRNITHGNAAFGALLLAQAQAQ